MPRNIVRGQEVSAEQAHQVRELRANSTTEERILWQELRRSNLGSHFRCSQNHRRLFRRFQLSPPSTSGFDTLTNEHQRGYDRVLGGAFAKLGIRTIRVTNWDVRDDLASVVNRIRAALKPNP